MATASKRRLIDLDAPQEAGSAVVVRYRGVLVSVTRERLLELLQTEEGILQAALGGAPAPAPQIAPDAQSSTPLDGGPVTHASLSTRIKKIHDYSAGSRHVRPTHAGLLAEVLAGFDWQIPPNPNTNLVQHLGELKSWHGVGAPLTAEIERFLTRYTAKRDAGR